METCSQTKLKQAVIGCFEKNRLSSMVKNILQRKKNPPNLFSQILNTVFLVFLKIDTRSRGLDKQNAINRHAC